MTGRDFEVKAKNSAGKVRSIVGIFVMLNILCTIWLADKWYIEDEWAISWGILSIMSLLLIHHMWESVYQMLKLIAILTKESD